MSSQAPSPLSERELEIMQLVVTGASNREIARSAGISANTVKVHLRNIFEKLGAASRTEATLIVVREGWVVVEGMAPTSTLDAAADSDSDEEDEEELAPPVVNLSDAAPPLEPATGRALPPRDTQEVAAFRDGQPSHLHAVALVVGIGLALLLMLAAVNRLRAPSTAPESGQPVDAPPRWDVAEPLPAARASAIALSVGSDLYLLGGDGAEGPAREMWHLGSDGTWETLAPLPEASRGAAAAALGGFIYVAGGQDAAGAPQAVLWRYDINEDRWSDSGADLPRPLADAALAPFEGDLYLFGGASVDSTERAIYRYDGSGWEVVGELPEPTRNLVAVAQPEGIILMGGLDAGGRPMDRSLRFDPRASDPLEALSPLPTASATGRAVALGGALYLLEGTRLYERDPAAGWHQIPAPDGGLPPNAALWASDPYLLIGGGGDITAPRSEVLRYEALYRTLLPIVPGN